MRKFSCNQQILQSFQSIKDEQLQELLSTFFINKGSLKHQELPELPHSLDNSLSSLIASTNECKLVPPIKEGCLTPEEHTMIDTILKEILGNTYQRTMLIHHHASAAYFRGELYGSVDSIHSSSATLYARTLEADQIPGLSHKFFKVSVLTNTNESIEIYFCAIQCLLEHPQRKWFHTPVEVWRIPDHRAQPNVIVPVSKINCRCAYTIDRISFSTIEEQVCVIIPLYNFCGVC